MRNFLTLIRKVTPISSNKKNNQIVTDCFGNYYTPLNYNTVKNLGGMKLITDILKLINDATKKQPYIINDSKLLAEKVMAKLELKKIIVNYQISHQILYKEFMLVLHTNGLWPMLLDHFVDYEVLVTEQEFRRVAGVIMEYLNVSKNKEKNSINQIANTCVHYREDGRLEIIFPGKLWGSKEVVNKILDLAEQKGIFIIEANSSPISQKIILPYNWSISEFPDDKGYYFIFDDSGKKVAVFRVTLLPNSLNNGEIDFFMEDMEDDEIISISSSTNSELKGMSSKSLVEKDIFLIEKK